MPVIGDTDCQNEAFASTDVRGCQASLEYLKRGVWLPKDAELPVVPTGFHILPRRWVVERTFAWLGLSRRLSKDYETHLDISEGMIYGAMIRIMIRRIARYEPS